MSSHNSEEKGQGAFVIAAIGLFTAVRWMVPAIDLFLLNRRISRISEFVKNDYFDRLISKNRKMMFFSLIPISLACTVSLYVYRHSTIMHKVEEKIMLVMKFKKISYLRQLSSMLLDPQLNHDLRIVLGSFAIAGFIGAIFQVIHPLMAKQRDLRRGLKKAGLADDGTEGDAFYTPVGILVNTGGKDYKEIISHTGLWNKLNIKIDKEAVTPDPSKLSVIFLGRAFELESKYIFDTPAES